MRRINNKQDLANRITESVLKEMGLKHSSRRKALKENREQEILDKVHSMRSNIFDMTEEGYGVLYIDYDPQTNELYAGGATNAGIIKEYSVDYDDSKSLDYNLEGLYEEILQSPPTDDTMAENKKRIRKIVSEALRKRLNEVSADLADRAASKAYRIGREGYGKYNPHDEIPFDSPHGKKFLQGEKFLKYRNEKLGANDDIRIFYPNGDTSVMVLKNYNTGEIITKPCRSVKELEDEYNKYKMQQ